MKVSENCLMIGCNKKVKTIFSKYCDSCKKTLNERGKYYKIFNKGKVVVPNNKVLKAVFNSIGFYAITLFFLFTFSKSLLASPVNVDYVVNTIIMAESSNNPLAVGDHGKSRGLMQIKEGTWKQYTKLSYDQAFDRKTNRAIGTSIVKDIIKKYGNKVTVSKVLFTYNSGIYVKKSIPAKWSIRHPNKVYRQAYLKDKHNNIIK